MLLHACHAAHYGHENCLCDRVSSFVGYGKETVWIPWNTLAQLTNTLLKLSCAPSENLNDVMLTIERFLFCYMTRPVHAQIYVDKAWQRLFTKRTNVKAIPPTGAAQNSM